ncbi:hypothetical protein B7P43_G06029 [Cryptotermes secundus]|uniref:Uncharacterized protein n=1 Tax=Cryptotermes secundus TaxID=105785 RepID=A0A2J7PDB4_9NEOP|nr:hypothetical protein B7P43_G06029 [Cryptotermes secundus]
MAVVNNLFSDHVISRYGDIIWPARSPDLSACEFFSVTALRWADPPSKESFRLWKAGYETEKFKQKGL